MLEAIVAVLVVLVAYVGWLAIDIVRAAQEYGRTRERLIEKFGLQEPLVFEPPVGYDQAKQDRFNELAPLFTNLPPAILTRPNEFLATLEKSKVAALVLAAKQISHREAIDFSPIPTKLPVSTTGIRPTYVLLYDFSLGHADSIESLRDAVLQTASDFYRPLGFFQIRKYGSIMHICRAINRCLSTTAIAEPLTELEEIVDSIYPVDRWDVRLLAEASEALRMAEESPDPSFQKFYRISNTKSLSSLPLMLPFFFGETALKAYATDHFQKLLTARELLQGQVLTIETRQLFGHVFGPNKYRGRALLDSAMENFNVAIDGVYVSALAELAIAKELVAIRRRYAVSQSLPDSYYVPHGIRYERTRDGFRISCEAVRYSVKV